MTLSYKITYYLMILLCIHVILIMIISSSRYGNVSKINESNQTQWEKLGISEITEHIITEHINTSSGNGRVFSHYRQISSDYGYVLGTHFSDQLTAGSINVFSLQCWAASLKDRVKVVEPFTRDGSHLGFDEAFLRNISSAKEYPQLYDYFDKEAWFSQTKAWNFSPLVPWDEFMTKAPRRIIIAGHHCDNDVNDEQFLAPTRFAQDNGFEILKKVCTNKEKRVSAQKYREMIYGQCKPSETVVLFIWWGGISATESPHEFMYREVISGLKKCERGSTSVYIPESQRITKNSQRYIDKYLLSNYISVMLRLEHFFNRHKLKNESERISHGKICINSILEKLNQLKKESGFTKVFLAMDTGKYGSSTFRLYNNDNADKILSKILFDGVYSDGSLSYQDWEQSFSAVTEYKAPGYIAMIQRDVAANAKYLILVGGGTFQVMAKSMQEHIYHSKSKSYSLCS